jgi:DNA-binding Xre family transcriptional regulator
MPHSLSKASPGSMTQNKAPIEAFTDDRKLEVVAQLTDDVLAKLTSAFFEIVSKEKWGKRDLSAISGINETAIGHILAGRRKNLTVETLALLSRAMRKRPELIFHDTRPADNQIPARAADAATQASANTPHIGLPRSAATALAVGGISLNHKSAAHVLAALDDQVRSLQSKE